MSAVLVVVGYFAIAAALAWLAGRFLDDGDLLAPASLVWPVTLPVLALYFVFMAIAEHGIRARERGDNR